MDGIKEFLDLLGSSLSPEVYACITLRVWSQALLSAEII